MEATQSGSGRRSVVRTGAVGASVVPAEVAQFNALADRWWDPDGPMRPLHRMNPCRVAWIAARVARHFGGTVPEVLDVGCGGGLLAESLARRGHAVLGIDAAADALAAARAHAAGAGLDLTYREAAAEDLLAEGAHFPVVTALEVIEHVADPTAFVRTLAGLVAPGGLLFLSTLNRTRRSYMVAKLGAEYLLRLLPVGTHDWNKFLTPAELAGFVRGAGLRVADTAGLSFSPLTGAWRESRDLGVNYILEARRGAA